MFLAPPDAARQSLALSRGCYRMRPSRATKRAAPGGEGGHNHRALRRGQRPRRGGAIVRGRWIDANVRGPLLPGHVRRGAVPLSRYRATGSERDFAHLWADVGRFVCILEAEGLRKWLASGECSDVGVPPGRHVPRTRCPGPRQRRPRATLPPSVSDLDLVRGVALEVDLDARHARQALARAHHVQVVHELHVDSHRLAQVLAERAQHLLQHVVGVA